MSILWRYSAIDHFFFLFFETELLCVTVLEFTLQARLSLNSLRSICLCFLSAGIRAMHHHRPVSAIFIQLVAVSEYDMYITVQILGNLFFIQTKCLLHFTLCDYWEEVCRVREQPKRSRFRSFTIQVLGIVTGAFTW